MTSVVFLIPAEEEMLEASEYYERQTFGLGSAFLAEVRRTVLRMAENLPGGRIVRPPIRRGLAPGFPFGILYRIDADEIVILAVMHLHRNPRYWMDRA